MHFHSLSAKTLAYPNALVNCETRLKTNALVSISTSPETKNNFHACMKIMHKNRCYRLIVRLHKHVTLSFLKKIRSISCSICKTLRWKDSVFCFLTAQLIIWWCILIVFKKPIWLFERSSAKLSLLPQEVKKLSWSNYKRTMTWIMENFCRWKPSS